MPTKDMKATQTNRTTLELLALVMTSGLMLLAAFSMIVQMDTSSGQREEGRHNVVAFLAGIQ